MIGSGLASQRAAIPASKPGKHVVVVERGPHVGDIDVAVGTISQTMREVALHQTVRIRDVIQQQSDRSLAGAWGFGYGGGR